MTKQKRQSGFTLLELIVVLTVVSILTLAVVLVLDPLQMIGRANDSRRMSDLEAIGEAIAHADSEGPSVESGGFDPDGTNSSTCAGQSDQTVYVSVPDSESPPDDLPPDWTYGQVTAANLQNIDGTGWLPVNFGGGMPGLYYGTVSGNINTTTANPNNWVTTSLAETEDAITDDTTEIYTGAIYDADGNISFTENIDDRSRIWIDGNLVLSSDTWSDRISTGNLSLSAGWHTIEIRISNGVGGSGPVTSPGIGYDPSGGSSWQHLEDDGTGSLLKTSSPTGGASPISALPVDPSNKFSSGFYYAYVCHKNGSFELTTRMVSEKHRTGGGDDVQSKDGGDDPFVYETGSDLTLNPKAPVGYWAFDGGTSGAISENDTVGMEDVSRNGHDGRADNDNAAGMSWTNGVMGGAINFDGVDDYVETSGSISLVANSFSTVAWFKTSVSADDKIFSNNVGYHQLQTLNGKLRICVNGCTAGSATVNDDQWHHAVSVGDATSVRAYLDGNTTPDITQAPAATVMAGIGRIGAVGGGAAAFMFGGTLEEISIYDRALTEEEIAYQYESLRP